MKNNITKILTQILVDLGISGVVPDVEISDDSAHGDYTTNVAMRLAKQLKKPPMEIALWVKDEMNKLKKDSSHKRQDQNTKQKDQKRSPQIPAKSVLQDIERIEVVPPGFINFFVSEAKLGTEFSEVLKQKESFGTAQSEKRKRVMVEFADPNPFKEFHIGHLRNISLGESYCRLMEATGDTVRRVNYQGDVGMHVAKSLYGLLHNPGLKAQASKTKNPKEKAEFLGKAYALGARVFEENEKAKKEVSDLNKKIYSQDSSIMGIYKQGRKWSLDYFDDIYSRLGTSFARFYFESEVAPLGMKIVLEHLADGIFEQSDGAIVYRGEKVGLHTRVFVSKEKYATYEAKDLALAPLKYSEWSYDVSIIMTGNEQSEYFKVMLAALNEISPDLAQKTRHMPFGMVNLKEGKMSSRTGNVITADWLIEAAKKRIYDILQKSESKYTKKDQEHIAEKASIAAIKYSMLKVDAKSDIAFDLKESVSFEGDSGPYLEYTYARCQSVLRKAKENVPSVFEPKFNREEHAVGRLINFFPEIVAQAAKNFAPNSLCSYLFELAQAFNLFYQKHEILKNKFRLTLTAATAQILKNGLYLLGIETVEQM